MDLSKLKANGGVTYESTEFCGPVILWMRSFGAEKLTTQEFKEWILKLHNDLGAEGKLTPFLLTTESTLKEQESIAKRFNEFPKVMPQDFYWRFYCVIDWLARDIREGNF